MSKGTVGRQELVAGLAKELGLSNTKCNEILTCVVDQIQDNVKKGKKVTIVGFGSFFPKKRAARKGHNPQTGQTIKIKANTVPGFKAGAKFKALVGK